MLASALASIQDGFFNKHPSCNNPVLSLQVMIPSKETKELTYQLLENNFIQLQELRKSLSANAISKSFYLFYVDINQVSRCSA